MVCRVSNYTGLRLPIEGRENWVRDEKFVVVLAYRRSVL
jgi:hypothetical protein